MVVGKTGEVAEVADGGSGGWAPRAASLDSWLASPGHAESDADNKHGTKGSSDPQGFNFTCTGMFKKISQPLEGGNRKL